MAEDVHPLVAAIRALQTPAEPSAPMPPPPPAPDPRDLQVYQIGQGIQQQDLKRAAAIGRAGNRYSVAFQAAQRIPSGADLAMRGDASLLSGAGSAGGFG